jgi:hypothetical protein
MGISQKGNANDLAATVIAALKYSNVEPNASMVG